MQNENTPKWARTDYKGFDTFKEDLAKANKTEEELGLLMCETFGLKILEYNNDNRYDIKFRLPNGTSMTTEVKEDFTCARTGNIGLEYSCRGKDSGIVTSKADTYLYKAHQRDGSAVNLLMTTKRLKQLVQDKRYFRTVNGGDPGSNSLNYLFKYEVIKDISRII